MTDLKKYNCLLASMSLLLNESPESLIKLLGHDGTEELWPGFKRAFHIQEFQYLLHSRGLGLVEYEAESASSPNENLQPLVRTYGKIPLIGRGIVATDGHAGYFDGYVIHDPKGFKVIPSNWQPIRLFYKLVRF